MTYLFEVPTTLVPVAGSFDTFPVRHIDGAGRVSQCRAGHPT